MLSVDDRLEVRRQLSQIAQTCYAIGRTLDQAKSLPVCDELRLLKEQTRYLKAAIERIDRVLD